MHVDYTLSVTSDKIMFTWIYSEITFFSLLRQFLTLIWETLKTAITHLGHLY